MEIRIGITNTGRELSFDTSESADTVKKSVATALDSGSTHLTFTDVKGNQYVVPTRGPRLHRDRQRGIAPRRLRGLTC